MICILGGFDSSSSEITITSLSSVDTVANCFDSLGTGGVMHVGGSLTKSFSIPRPGVGGRMKLAIEVKNKDGYD